MKPAKTLPDWAINELIEGIQLLYALRLIATPPEDALEQTVQAWSIVLASHGNYDERDIGRIKQGFLNLATWLERWPAPTQLLNVMPSRPEPRYLPPPPLTPEEQTQRNGFFSRLYDLIGIK